MQKGFVLIPLVIGLFLIGTVVGVGGYYFFNQQKVKSITNFEECAKYYPVMESYPEQCNTPEGKHFTKERVNEKSENLKQSEATASASWKKYEGSLISFKYPEDHPWDTYTGDPDREPAFFDFYDYKKSSNVAMQINVRKLSEYQSQIYNSKTTANALAQLSRTNKLSNPYSKKHESVTQVKPMSLDNHSGYYYDFEGGYDDPSKGGFVMDDDCNSRAIFVVYKNTAYEIIYCQKSPYEEIYNSISLK